MDKGLVVKGHRFRSADNSRGRGWREMKRKGYLFREKMLCMVMFFL